MNDTDCVSINGGERSKRGLVSSKMDLKKDLNMGKKKDFKWCKEDVRNEDIISNPLKNLSSYSIEYRLHPPSRPFGTSRPS